jgi:hypothetical protein
MFNTRLIVPSYDAQGMTFVRGYVGTIVPSYQGTIVPSYQGTVVRWPGHNIRTRVPWSQRLTSALRSGTSAKFDQLKRL